MSARKKILFISCSAGSGHIQAAEALLASAREFYPEISSEHINLSDNWNFLARHAVTSPYDFAVKYCPSVYGAAYSVTDNWPIKQTLALFNFMWRFGVDKHLEPINKFEPDAILYTHFIPALMLSKYISVPQFMLVTDYYAHRIWHVPGVEKYFVADESVKNSFAAWGAESEATGLPVNPEFRKTKNTAEIKKELGIENDWPVILFLPTIPGKVDLADFIEQELPALAAKFGGLNALVIAGKNERLLELKRNKTFNLIRAKRVDNMDEWMRAADFVVTKAGGMTITEAAYLQKPIIIINPIPGQEEYNAQNFLSEKLCALAMSNEELAQILKAALGGQLNLVKKTPVNACQNILRSLIG